MHCVMKRRVVEESEFIPDITFTSLSFPSLRFLLLKNREMLLEIVADGVKEKHKR